MRVITIGLFLVAAACAGPNQAKLAETPTAQSKANTGLAPAASASDEDREEVVQGFDQQNAAERARKEAGEESTPPAPTPKPAGTPGKAKPALEPAAPDKK
jgi:hypothetical protein